MVAIGLVISGAFFVVGSMIYILYVLLTQMKNLLSEDNDDVTTYVDRVFVQIIRAILGMTVGSLILIIGVVVGIVQIILKFQ
jgi:hypothetical protein